MAALRRRGALMALLALLCAGCGGGTGAESPVAPSPAPSTNPGPAQPVVLDPGNFDTLVLAPGRTSLVEFQLPT